MHDSLSCSSTKVSGRLGKHIWMLEEWLMSDQAVTIHCWKWKCPARETSHTMTPFFFPNVNKASILLSSLRFVYNYFILKRQPTRFTYLVQSMRSRITSIKCVHSFHWSVNSWKKVACYSKKSTNIYNAFQMYPFMIFTSRDHSDMHKDFILRISKISQMINYCKIQ